MRIVAGLTLASAVLLMASSTASAQWGYGSGGSWGGGGSSGGSSGGYYGSSGGSRGGSSGGYQFRTPVRNFFARMHNRIHSHRGASSGGSWGGSRGGYYTSVHYASSGGSSGGASWGSSYTVSPGSRGYGSTGYGSTGYGSTGYGSTGSGSSGESNGSWSTANYYQAPSYSQPVYSGNVVPMSTAPGTISSGVSPVYVQPGYVMPGNTAGDAAGGSVIESGQIENQRPPMPSDSNDGGAAGADDTTSTSLTGDAYLTVALPKEAKVYVNGRLTQTPGDVREYVSRGLAYGVPFTYELRAEVEVDGQTKVQTMTVDLLAGQNKDISFDFETQTELITSVALTVPDDAKVVLGGVETSSLGPVRYFSTKQLAAGESWDDYKIEVTVVRDGKPQTRTETVNIAAGDSVRLNFDFDPARAAGDVVAAK